MHHRPKDRQMDRRKGLIIQDPFHKNKGLIMFFQNSRVKLPYIIWLDCEPYEKNQYEKKEYNQHTSVFKEFKKQ